MWFCKNSGQQSIKSSYLHIGVLKCLQLSIVDINWMAGSVFGGISYNVSTIFAKSREKSHRLWTKNLSLARGLLALQIKIPLEIHFLGPWEGGKRLDFFLVTLTSPPGHPTAALAQPSHRQPAARLRGAPCCGSQVGQARPWCRCGAARRAGPPRLHCTLQQAKTKFQ